MKLSENQTVDNNIFKTFQTAEPVKYSELFDDVSPSTLYYLLINQCGEKTVIELCNNIDNLNLFKIIKSKYGDSWLKIKTAIKGQYDVFEPFNLTETITEDVQVDGTTSGTDTTTSKVNGFNSETPVDDSENVSETSQTSTDNKTRTNEKIKKGNNLQMTNAELLRQEINVRQTSFLDIVLNNIADFITLDVYQ